MGEYQTLKWESDGRVVTITLDRPEKLNAMSWDMFLEIGRAFEAAGADPEIRCVVVTGTGRAFSSGADLTDPANLVSSAFDAKDRMERINRTVRAFVDCPKPTIAKVTGVAAGAGCNLALSCDFIVATSQASFAELFVKRGLLVDFGGTWILPRLVPLAKAKEIALLGDTISAQEAADIGLITRLCEPGEIDEVVKQLTERLVALPPR
ncbi:MAG TPA: enoyl-CoA hydratase/isomerase family protein, partial [Actinomycetota bacterium]|nr:enoyl-CoA hydratase/isomerase family protein [Actinomycetota bacterium]